MPSPSNKKKANKDAQNVSMLYDSALPVSLKKKGLEAVGRHIATRKGQASPSPYIVHLSREQEMPQPLPTEQHINDLEKTLIIDDILEEQVDESETTEGLMITLDDLALQLREPDVAISIASTITQDDRNEFPALEPSQAPLTPLSTTWFDEPEPITQQTQAVTKRPAIRFSLPSIEDWIARLPRLLPAQVRYRAIASFVVLSMFAVLPLQATQSLVQTTQTRDDITSVGTLAIDELQRGASAIGSERYDVAQSDFDRAGDRFAQAQDSLESMHLAVAALVNLIPQTDRTYETVRGLVIAGKELSQAASLFAGAADELSDKDSLNLTKKLNLLSTYIAAAQPHVSRASDALESVDPKLVPQDQQSRVSELTATVPQLKESLQEFLTFSQTLSLILGDEQKMRYLVSFQNNTELRATGGFTGSFAEMDLLEGRVEHVHIPEGGTYDVQGQLTSFVEAPQPLTLINNRWEFHDANWFPDFPSSANKMLDFYTDAGGPTVDGLLAINATLLPELLAITGPIEMPEYGRTINAENFLFETQKIVEYEYTQYQDETGERKEDAPKQFIGDLAPILLERLATADMETLLKVADVLGNALTQKDIQVYFSNNDLQSQMEALGWDGSVKQTSGDYLMVVNTNLGGGKTDSVISQNVDVDMQITPQGDVVNTVTITKEHHGLVDALFEGANNVDYLRIYVPRGSELIEAEGFEVPPSELFEPSSIPLKQDEDLALMTANWYHDPAYDVDTWEESGKTVFGSWMQTAPGEVEVVTFTYRLPWRFDLSSSQNLFSVAKARLGLHNLQRYSLLVQKQSGVETRTTDVSLHLPESLKLIWGSHEGLLNTGVSIENDQDVFVHFLLEQ